MGTEQFDISVSLRAAEYIAGGEKIVNANLHMQESFIESIKSVEFFEESLSGKSISKGLRETVKEVDAFGKKTTTVFETIAGKTTAVSSAVIDVISELKAANAEADRLAADRKSKFKGFTRGSSGINPLDSTISGAEQDSFLRAEKTFLSLIKSSELGTTSITTLTLALKKARAGVINKLTADGEAEIAAVRLAEAERKLGSAFEANQKKVQAAADIETIALNKRNALIAEGAAAQQAIQGLNAAGRGGTASDAEKTSFDAARKSLVRLAETGKLTGADIAAAIAKMQSGMLQFGQTTDLAEDEVLRLFNALNKLGSKSLAARTAELKKQAEATRKNNLAIQEQAGLELQVAGIRKAGRAGVNLGKGTEAQVKGFLKAEQALLKLGRAGKVTEAEVVKALQRIEAETLSYATAATEAEVAALDLAAAQSKVGEATKKAAGPFRKFFTSAVDLVKVTGIGLFIGNVFRLQGALEESITDAAELSRKLAEIDTIQSTNALTTETWAKELRQLSNDFGIPVLDQAEAAYQTLSNQVAQGAEAVRFLGAANRLAVTGITDASSAVNLLTSAVNAFRLPVEETNDLSAKFFKTVELGRLRIEELSDIFGRVAVPANQLGVSIDEVNAAVATLSIQGIKADESVTLLRNIIQKLIRPGDKLQATLAKLGFSSGQAAIETLGFGGVLAALEKEVGGNVEEVGELFQRIRAVTGVLGFAGEQAEVFQKNLAAIKGADVNTFLEDTNKVLDSTGQTLKRASEQAKNFFEESFGTPVLDSLAKTITALGGAEEAIEGTIDAFQIFASTAVVGAAITGGLKLAVALDGMTLSTAAATVATKALNAALAVNPWIVLALAITAASEAAKQFAEKDLRDAEKAAGRSAKRVARIQDKAAEVAKKRSQLLIDTIGDITKASRKSVASRRADLESLSRKAADSAKLIEADFKSINRQVTKDIARTVKAQAKLFTDSEKAAKNAVAEIEKVLKSIDLGSLNADLEVGGLGLQAKFLQDEITQAREAARKASERGDLKTFQAESKRADALAKRQLDVSIKLSKEELKVNEKRIKLEAKLKEATSTKERDNLRKDLKDLRERLNIIREGTKTQLEGLTELQKARRKQKDAGTFKEQREANKQLKELEARQRRINKQVEEERDLRKQLIQQSKDQANQLLNILKLNAKQQKDAAKQNAEIANTKFLLGLVTEEAKTFKEAQAFAGKSAEEINKSVAVQQKRFSEIIALQEKLGAGPEGRDILEKKAAGLQKRTQIAINKLREDQNNKEIKAIQNKFAEEVKGLKAVTREDNKRVGALRTALQDAAKTFNEIIGKTEPLDRSGALTFGAIERSNLQIGREADQALGITRRFGVDPSVINRREVAPTRVNEQVVFGKGSRGELGGQILELSDAVKKLDKRLEEQARPNRVFTTQDAAGNKQLQNTIVRIAGSLSSRGLASRGDPGEDPRGFQGIVDLFGAAREGVQSAERLSKANNILLEGLQEQAKLTGVSTELERLNTNGKKVLISEQEKQVKSLKALRAIIDESIAKREAGAGTSATAVGLSTDLIGGPDGSSSLSQAFKVGGIDFGVSILEAFNTAAGIIKGAITTGGTEAGKNQADALVDQTAARKKQAEEQLAAEEAARQKALDDAKKLAAKEAQAGEAFVDREGRFIARGGGAGVGSAGFDLSGFGKLAARGGVGVDVEGKFISRNKRKNFPDRDRSVASTKDTGGPLKGQDAAEKALADFLAKRGRKSSFGLGGSAGGQASAEQELSREQLRQQAGRLAAKQSEELLPKEAGRFVGLLEKVTNAQKALEEAKARAAESQGLNGEGGVIGQPSTVAFAQQALNSAVDALFKANAENVEKERDALIAGAPTVAKGIFNEDDGSITVTKENTAAVASATEASDKLVTALDNNRTAYQKRLFGDSGSGPSEGFKNRIFGDSSGGPSEGFRNRMFGDSGSPSAGFLERHGFTPQIRPTNKTAQATSTTNTNSNNTNSNNSNIKISIVSPDPAQAGAKVTSAMEQRDKRLGRKK